MGGGCNGEDSRTVVGAPDETVRDHVLLTVLGTAPHAARYRLGDREVEQPLAPLALYDLLAQPDRPGRVAALCTPEAQRDSWPALETALDGRCRTELVRVCGGETPEEINAFMARVADAVGDKADITVDITHGPRHFSFLTYLVVLYVSALRGVRVRGAWYGLLRENGSSPFLDLRGLLELPRWLHALRALNDTGSARPLAHILRSDSRNPSAKKMAKDLAQLSDAYLSGIPLELGWQADLVRKQHIKPLRKLISNDYRLPLGDELAGQIDDFLRTLALPVAGNGWKSKVLLDERELKRQVRHIDDLLDRGHVATALGLMSEWTVSWVVWVRGQTREWLDYRGKRRGAANLLNAIEAVGEDKALREHLDEEQQRLGTYWGQLRGLRNGYAHHGMRPQVLVGNQAVRKNLDHVRRYWSRFLRACPAMRLSLGAHPDQHILVSPIGMRPGVLFSALQAYRSDGDGHEPDLCLVICSHETAGPIAEATDRAGYRGTVERLWLNDPYGDRSEIERLAKAARRHFVGAGEVVVNVTGGTTLMGLVAEAVAGTARGLACPVRRFGLIDRRTAAEQEKDPWRAGEPFWLDEREDDDADGD